MASELAYQRFLSPIGQVNIEASDQGVTSVFFSPPTKRKIQNNRHADAAEQQLQDYFAGKLTHFDVALDLKGTEFQQSVWQALISIDFGNTCSYQHIASTIQKPSAVRAVGAANGKNPIAIIVPCHRVIGKNGTLTGYAGGLERKAWLLDWEAK